MNGAPGAAGLRLAACEEARRQLTVKEGSIPIRATILRIVVLLAATLLGVPGEGGAACKSTCTEELRACRVQCRGGANRRECRRRCAKASTCTAPGVRGRTGAYVVNECRNDAAGFMLHERLFVRRGNCDPVTIMDLPAVGPVADPSRVCDLYGKFRVSYGSVLFGRFQRIGVTPDGRGVIVEVTNDHVVSGLETLSPEPPDEGIFFVSADGMTKTRRIGQQSARKIIERRGNGFAATASPVFVTSPNGRFVAYEDRGPDADGRDADQIVVIDLTNDERTQITHLSDAPQGNPRTGIPTFVDDRTILFYNGPAGGPFTVRVDGTELPRAIPSVTSIEDGKIVLDFGIVGSGGNVVGGRLPDRIPKVDYGIADAMVRELFLVHGTRALQLTGFDYPDTGGGVRSALGRDHVVFIASADPRGENPDGVCQLFSVDVLAGHLRQLTRFPDDGGEKHGCRAPGPGFACQVNGLAEDPVTSAIVFDSSCNPLGRNPNGAQFFSMRPDGTGLRQITSFRGIEPLEDGGVQVEMSGPAAYSFVVR
jgi:hypothetical protein